MYTSEADPYTPLVARVFRIEAVTWGDPKKNFLVRYEGCLYQTEQSEQAYDQLADSLRTLNVTPLFRVDRGKQAVVLTPGVYQAKPSSIRNNLIFFGLTVISVFIVGLLNSYEGTPNPTNTTELLQGLLPGVGLAIAYTVALMSILLSHEFGHYLISRYHKTAATLPYFIPLPLPPFGTLGAVIFQREPHKNKKILMDIGMAGPLAGLVVAIPVLLLGLALSTTSILTVSPGISVLMEGNSILYLVAKYVVFHQWLPSPVSFGGLSPILYWIRYFFTGMPFPNGGLDVNLHPVAWAGWAGLLVTALNLIPAGQLDGGHILHGLFGRYASAVLPVIVGVLVVLGFVWPGWWLWVLLIVFLGRSHPETLDQITPLDTRRKVMAVICLIIFVLVFVPVPLSSF